jgi:hypothetical protein
MPGYQRLFASRSAATPERSSTSVTGAHPETSQRLLIGEDNEVYDATSGDRMIVRISHSEDPLGGRTVGVERGHRTVRRV